MLVAYGPGGAPVVAGETPLEQLQRWSQEHALRCPNCRGVVHVRGGPEKRTQLHFAHLKGECAWSTESESVRHMRGKMVLAEWLRKQFPQAGISLEERLPAPNRIADIYVTHTDGRRCAIEFQCAPLDVEEWRLRHAAYRRANIQDTWVVGNNRREKQEALLEALIPLVRAYLRDPDLLRRYNYGRGRWDQPISDADRHRVQQARGWLERLSQQNFLPATLAELAKE